MFMLVTFIAALSFSALFFAAEKVRYAIIMKDGKMDKTEEMWEDVVQESENEIFALAVSYLLIRGVAVLLGEPVGSHHAQMSNTAIFFATMLAVFFLPAMAFFHLREKQNHLRKFAIAQTTCSFAFAWCGLEAVTWKCMQYQHAFSWSLVCMEIIVALLVSFAGVLFIILFDAIADMESTPPVVDNCVRDCALAFGVLIGFSWERAFDRAKEDVSMRIGWRYEGKIDDIFGVHKDEVNAPGSTCSGTCASAAYTVQVLGTAFAVGCTVEGQCPRELQVAIDDGEIDVPEE